MANSCIAQALTRQTANSSALSFQPSRPATSTLGHIISLTRRLHLRCQVLMVVRFATLVCRTFATISAGGKPTVSHSRLPPLGSSLTIPGHINNLYNTTFWALIQLGGLDNKEAEKALAVRPPRRSADFPVDFFRELSPPTRTRSSSLGSASIITTSLKSSRRAVLFFET